MTDPTTQDLRTTTERELIKRLADALETYTYDKSNYDNEAIVAEARAYLAQPEPEGPTRDEAVSIYSEVMAAHDCQTLGDMAEHFANAVLARWGTR